MKYKAIQKIYQKTENNNHFTYGKNLINKS